MVSHCHAYADGSMHAEHARHQRVQSSSRAVQTTHDTCLRRDLCQRTSGTYSIEKQRRRAGGREAPSSCYRLMRPSTSSRVIRDNTVMKMWQSIGRTGASALAEHGLQTPSCSWALLSCAGVRHVVDLCAAPGSWSQVGLAITVTTSESMPPFNSSVMAGVCLGLKRACGCAKASSVAGCKHVARCYRCCHGNCTSHW